MNFIFLDTKLKSPIYKQLSQSIQTQIENGNLTYGDKLPTELELAEAYMVSQTVIKKTYRELIKKSLIKRIKGKGTYVTNREIIKVNLSKILTLDQDFSSKESKYVVKTLLVNKLGENIFIRSQLGINESSSCIVAMRMVSEGKNPVMIQRIYMPQDSFKDFKTIDLFSQTLISLIESRSGRLIKDIQQVFRVVNLSSWVCVLLDVEEHDPGHIISSRFLDAKGQPIAYVISYLTGEFTYLEQKSND